MCLTRGDIALENSEYSILWIRMKKLYTSLLLITGRMHIDKNGKGVKQLREARGRMPAVLVFEKLLEIIEDRQFQF